MQKYLMLKSDVSHYKSTSYNYAQINSRCAECRTCRPVEQITHVQFQNLMSGFHLEKIALTLFANFAGQMDSSALNVKIQKVGSFPQNWLDAPSVKERYLFLQPQLFMEHGNL